MAAPALVGRAAVVLVGEDLGRWAVRVVLLVVLALLVPLALVLLAFAALLGLLGGGAAGGLTGGGTVRGGPPTSAAVSQIPAEQLALMQAVAASSSCGLPWTVLAAIANVESGFGRTADQVSAAGAYGYGQFLQDTWRTYGGDIPWRTTDPQEQARPVGERRDSTNFRYALPAMARYLCAAGAGQDLRKAIFAYNHADWYVAEVMDLATRYGGVAASGGGLVPNWANAPALDQFDRRNYRSDTIWLTWDKAACSAAALTWLLRAYGIQVPAIDDAIGWIGPFTGISPSAGPAGCHGWAPRAGDRRPQPQPARATGWPGPAETVGLDRGARGLAKSRPAAAGRESVVRGRPLVRGHWL